MNYYNDNDPFCCAWLRELIRDGLIPEGKVDDRSITEIEPKDLKGFTQAHFFCGIGGWPYALSLAGWGAERPVWSGSCPCQSLSVAGLGKGHEDERHLWPEFARLICECRPPVVFGEQVASALGREWLAGIRLDLAQMGYAVGAADLCAAGVRAPHIRQRLFWVADRQQQGLEGHAGDVRRGDEPGRIEKIEAGPVAESSPPYRLADAESDHRRPGERRAEAGVGEDGIGRGRSSSGGPPYRLADAADKRTRWARQTKQGGNRENDRILGQNSTKNFWHNSILIPCADGRWRRVPGKRVADAKGNGNKGHAGKSCEATVPDEATPRKDHGRSVGGSSPRGEGDIAKQRLEIEPGFQPLVDGISAFLGDAWHEGLAEGEGAIHRLQEGAAKITGGMTTLFPLCETVPGRVGLLKGAGNAISPQVAAEFIKCVMS